MRDAFGFRRRGRIALLLGLAAAPVQDLPNPPELRSRDGLLQATLRAAPARITVAGRTFTSNVFDGRYAAPTLRVRRGDRVRLRYVNATGPADVQLDAGQPTNMHYHGMNIPPREPADYIYLMIPPKGGMPPGHAGHMSGTPSSRVRTDAASGLSYYDYDWRVPPTQPQGTYWYHPHAHSFVEGQVLSGMAGMLIVEGLVEEQYPELRGVRERIMQLKDIVLPGAPDEAPKTKTINGLAEAPVRIRPGEVQLWRLGNIGANSFFDLAVAGHSFWVLARDGNPLAKPVQTDHLFLPPAARVTVAVVGGAPGRHAIRSRAVDTGPQGDPNPEVKLGELVVAGAPANPNAALRRLRVGPVRLEALRPLPEDVRKLPITRRRTITFSESADGDTFFIDGKEFDPNRIDATVRLGEVEEWTIRNVTGELHTFHIHQVDFLVVSEPDAPGQPRDALGLRDVIDLPYQRDGKPGEVKIIIPFTDPRIVGKFVYHCHILEHEDGGMMANIVVKRPGE